MERGGTNRYRLYGRFPENSMSLPKKKMKKKNVFWLIKKFVNWKKTLRMEILTLEIFLKLEKFFLSKFFLFQMNSKNFHCFKKNLHLKFFWNLTKKMFLFFSNFFFGNFWKLWKTWELMNYCNFLNLIVRQIAD